MSRFPFRPPPEDQELIGADGDRAMPARSGFDAFEHGTGLFDSPILSTASRSRPPRSTVLMNRTTGWAV